MLRSSVAPLSMASVSLLYTSVGRYLNIFSRLNTYFAKYSDGLLPGDFTSSGFVWKAFSTTLNLSVDIFCLFL